MISASEPQPPSPEVASQPACLPEGSPRARLAHDIRIALRRAGHAELRNVEIDVDRDCVCISGRVSSFYLKQLSQELSRNVAPCLQISNRLQVDTAPQGGRDAVS